MKAGDHLDTPRTGYTHHGLYVGDGKAIHYSGFADGLSSGPVCLASLDEFCGGKVLRVVEHAERLFSHEESVARAFGRLGENRYNLLFNNCEHFVTRCIQGRKECRQIREKSAFCARLVLQCVQVSRHLRNGRRAGSIFGSAWTRSSLIVAAIEGVILLSAEALGRGSSDV